MKGSRAGAAAPGLPTPPGCNIVLVVVIGAGSNLVKHHVFGLLAGLGAPAGENIEPEAAIEAAAERREPFLAALGERAKALRLRRGLSRKALARATGVSERHLANLEYGVGNASILILQQVAQALENRLNR